MKSYSYPRAATKGERIIELLSSTQTIIAGVDRVIVNNVEPVVLDPAVLDFLLLEDQVDTLIIHN